jgi:hypothetical protein
MNFLNTCLAVVAITITMTGCDSVQPQGTAPPAKPQYQRFVPIPTGSFFIAGIPWHGYFALDTKTGTLCRTIKFKVFPKGSPIEWANDVPSCNDILASDHD